MADLLKNEDMKLGGTLQIWRNQLTLVLNQELIKNGEFLRLEELGTKYSLEFEEHRTIKNVPDYEYPEYLGYRINRTLYPERIRRVIRFQDKYYYLSQKTEASNQKILTFYVFEDGENEDEWKKFYLPKESKKVVLY